MKHISLVQSHYTLINEQFLLLFLTMKKILLKNILLMSVLLLSRTYTHMYHTGAHTHTHARTITRTYYHTDASMYEQVDTSLALSLILPSPTLSLLPSLCFCFCPAPLSFSSTHAHTRTCPQFHTRACSVSMTVCSQTDNPKQGHIQHTCADMQTTIIRHTM